MQLLFDWGSGNEKLLAHRENILVPDDQTALFFEPFILYTRHIVRTK